MSTRVPTFSKFECDPDVPGRRRVIVWLIAILNHQTQNSYFKQEYETNYYFYYIYCTWK